MVLFACFGLHGYVDFFKPVAVVAAFVVLACPLVDVMQYLNGSNLCFGVFVQLFFLKITSCG